MLGSICLIISFIPKGSIVAISTVGVKEHDTSIEVWTEGMKEMIKQIEPSTILVYGGDLEFDYGDIKTVSFENKVTEKWSKGD